jgi:ribonuclease HI
MKSSTPHYLLLSTSQSRSIGGHWRFVLESLESDEQIDVRDSEPNTSGERLELMVVLRGLEALDQPSRVTLVTPSRYVVRGIRFGLEAWRQNGWHWENHGEMVPIKDHDLWQRMDQAMRIHDVRMRHWTAARVAPNRGLLTEAQVA